MPDQTERLESVKAGISGAIALTGCFAALEILALVLQAQGLPLGNHPTPWETQGAVTLALRSNIALGSGFLFGIAYRYIVRDNRNPHLQQGAVFAFTGVRIGALLESRPDGFASILDLSFWDAAIESAIAFWLTSVVLDWLLQHQWVQRIKD